LYPLLFGPATPGVAWRSGRGEDFTWQSPIPFLPNTVKLRPRLGLNFLRCPKPWLDWIRRKARIYEPAPVGKQRSRDLDDDLVLSCALAAQAEIIVSKDKDLLVLGKPFGIEILSPGKLLAKLKRRD
jgi:hypothetical protein